MPAAARTGDNHSCPMTNPPPANSPHTGGPILPGDGKPSVFIGGQPAATVGNKCTCAGPPDSIVKGSLTVKIMGKSAARQGDSTAHGGSITAGLTTVIIGG
ncbi:MAG: PAAR domain-containing protein [Bacteroidetes bacterium]|nr:PAAR domain-containing protein [Bacteroidota bacterium]